MARADLEFPFKESHGAIEKHGTVNRKKKFRNSRGRIIGEGIQESYKIANPRDWKKNPASEAELAHRSLWQEVCFRTAEILQSAQPGGPTQQQLIRKQVNNVPDYYTPEEVRRLYAQYYHRFLAQMPRTRGKHPDPQAPLDKHTKTPKRYAQFPNFVRAMIHIELKSAE